MGKRGGGGKYPYNNGSGAFGDGLLPFLAWWHKHLFGPLGESFENAADRLWGIRRSRRWLICGALGILTLIISGLIVIATVEGAARDLAIVTTQGSEQGILVEEDYSACLMEIELHGRTVKAQTSCNTNSSFTAGTQVSVAQDPSYAEGYLVVSPGQDWHEATSDDIWFGVIAGTVFALLVVWLGHYVLLHPDRPESPLDQRPPVPAAGTPGPRGGTALDRFGESWESKKATAGQGWLNFVELDVRIRGTILSAMVIAVTGVIFVLGDGTNADLAHDRALAKTQPIVNTTLLDFGGRGMNPTVRIGTKAVMLDYELRWEIFYDLGDNVAVVEDPQFPGRLIPSELADSRGLWGLLMDNGPMIILWTAIVGFLAWMFIPRELAAAGEAFEVFLRRGRPKGRH